jgi:hypothetical protein
MLITAPVGADLTLQSPTASQSRASGDGHCTWGIQRPAFLCGPARELPELGSYAFGNGGNTAARWALGIGEWRSHLGSGGSITELVWSRDEVAWIDHEGFGVFRPGGADSL